MVFTYSGAEWRDSRSNVNEWRASQQLYAASASWDTCSWTIHQWESFHLCRPRRFRLDEFWQFGWRGWDPISAGAHLLPSVQIHIQSRDYRQSVLPVWRFPVAKWNVPCRYGQCQCKRKHDLYDYRID